MRGNDMDSDKSLIVFQDKKMRRLWYNDEWHFSVSDIIAILTDSKDELAYWRKLKRREPQLVTICHGLKLPAKDLLVELFEKNLNTLIINNVYKSQVVNTNV